MIWFNISNLEDKISKNELSDKDGFNYVLAYFILFSVMTINVGSQNLNIRFEFLNCFISIFITIWGLNAVYKANSDIDGKDFFKRFFAINWVIGMRLILVVVVLIIFLEIVKRIFLLGGDNYLNNSILENLIMTILFSVIEVIYYLLVINSIRRLKPITE